MRSKEDRDKIFLSLEMGLKNNEDVSSLRELALQCLEIAHELEDENESLWGMMDEMKKSDMETWSKKNQARLQSYVDNHIKYLKWQNKLKGEA